MPPSHWTLWGAAGGAGLRQERCEQRERRKRRERHTTFRNRRCLSTGRAADSSKTALTIAMAMATLRLFRQPCCQHINGLGAVRTASVQSSSFLQSFLQSQAPLCRQTGRSRAYLSSLSGPSLPRTRTISQKALQRCVPSV